MRFGIASGSGNDVVFDLGRRAYSRKDIDDKLKMLNGKRVRILNGGGYDGVLRKVLEGDYVVEALNGSMNLSEVISQRAHDVLEIRIL